MRALAMAPNHFDEHESRLDSRLDALRAGRGPADMSLVRRLTRLNLLVLSLSMLIAFSVIAIASWVAVRERQVHAAEISAAMLANSVASMLAFEDRDAAQSELAAFSRRSDLIELQVFLPDGRLFSQWLVDGGRASPPPATPFVALPGMRASAPAVSQLRDAELEVWVPIALKGEIVGALRLRESMQTLQQLGLQFSGLALALIVAMIMIASRVLNRVQRLGLSPILELSELAERVMRERDYGLRAVVRRRDEVGRLTQRFNAMLRRVEARQNELSEQLQQEMATGQQMQELAHRDILTQLPNRLYFQGAVQRSVERSNHSGELMALMFIDLDNFKHVNDRHGHEAGDRVLVEVARRMSAVLRSGDVLCRLGGDEFALLLPGLPEVESAELLAGRLIAAVREPLIIDGVQMPVGATVGLAFCPDDAEEASELLRRADEAMYEAKRAGKNTYRRVIHEES